jgi:preprotein translocase subunit SecD
MPSRHLPLAAVLAAGSALGACQPAPPAPKTADQLVCADPAAPSRVNFRLVMNREATTPYPGADLFESPDYPGAPPLTVRRRVAISGRHILRVEQGFAGAEPMIVILFTPQGASEVARATDAPEDGERLALILDGKLVAAPHFGRPITADSLQITMGGSPAEAEALAKALSVAAKGCTPPRRPT